jgi:hypothetical protein
MLKRSLSYSQFGVILAVFCVWGVHPAWAQQGKEFYDINSAIIDQVATVPVLFKQLTVIIGIMSVLVGLHGFYKGLTDSRSPGMQWKKLSLILIGSLLLYIGSLALTAEKTVFKESGANGGIYWQDTTSKIKVFQ